MPEPTDERNRESWAVGGQRPRDDAQAGALLSSRDSDDFRRRWEDAQTRFVEEPRAAVEEADALVGEVLDRLAATFRGERDALQQSRDDEQTDTEALRVAFQRYRSFFQRLLSA